MPQLSLYLDDSTLSVLRDSAARANCSMSKYAGDLIRKDAERSAWPNDFWSLYGSIADDSFTEPAELSWANDSPRTVL